MTTDQSPKLFTLSYKSVATAGFDLAALNKILVTSRIRNQQGQVTGVLIFMEDVFTQYLEGPEQAVLEIFELIKSSRHHHEVEELSRGWIATRKYPDWSMSYFSSQLKSEMPLTFDHAPASFELGGALKAGSSD